ncbi:MAG: SpoIID/LytB domain-containing protein [Chloroflexi bacterium]|nr:MAG: SpoIID/LytB domain-containing protein [Chloroflexota bacterium]
MCSSTRGRRALLRLAAAAILAASAGSALLRPATPSADADTFGPAARLHVQLAGVPGPPAGGWLRVGDVGSFAGSLTFEQTSGHLGVVNSMSLEDYVRGISEMPGDWPIPSLEAQAVAARTFGLYHVLVNGDHGPWPGTDAEICATDKCQVYRGLPDGVQASRWVAAVAATAGQVLMYRGGVIESFYASSDGGRTRSGSVPWLPSVEDPDDSLSPLHHWTWAAPLASFAPVVGIRPDQLVALSSTADSVVATVRQPPGAGTAQRSIDAEQFKADANSDLPSPPGLPVALPGPYFTLTTQPSGTVQVEGWGHGHGLGMSQYGALGKALRGMSAGAILGAYYGPARATRLPQRRIPAEVRVLVSDDHTTATLVGSGPVQVLDDHGQLLGAAPTGALSGDLGPGGIRARVVPRPPVTAPVPPPPLRGRVPAFADVRTPALPPTGPAPGPPALSTGAPQPQPQPAAIVHPPPPPPARIAPLVTTGARSRVPVTALSAGGAGVVVLGALVAVGVRRVRPRRR